MSQIYSNKINVSSILMKIDYLAILRMGPDFPNYKSGSDIDIFCNAGGHTVDDLTRMLPLKQTVKSKTHVHLDFIVNGKLDLRFDLYTHLISKEFSKDLFMSTTVMPIGTAMFFVPSQEFDGILKCYEYIKHPRRKQKYKEFLKYKDRLDEYTN